MIVMSGILSIVIGNRSIGDMKNEIGNSLTNTAYQMSERMDSFMWSRAGEIYTLSKLDALQDFNEADSMRALLNELKSNFPVFAWVGVSDMNGVVIAATNGILEGADISKRPVFTEGIKGKFIGDVHEAVLLANLLPNPSGEPMKFVDVSLPITNQLGNTIGVLSAHLSWEWARDMEKSIMDPLYNQQNIEMFVISGKDNTILLGNRDSIGNIIQLEGTQMARDVGSHFNIETWDDGKEYLTGYALADGYLDYEGLDWTIVVRQPLNLAYNRVTKLQLYINVVGIICAIIFSYITFLITNKVAKPIINIANIADKIKLGNGAHFPSQNGIKEIDDLSLSLQELLNSLQVSEMNANHDHLTGLLNRKGLEKQLKCIIESECLKGNLLSFLCLDLDGFKSVNDSYGHYIGDLLLIQVATRLENLVKEKGIVARQGGDEFVVILYNNGDIGNNKQVAKAIIEKMNTPFELENYSLTVGCSIGIATCNGSDDIIASLQLADERLYTSKRKGKNCYTFK